MQEVVAKVADALIGGGDHEAGGVSWRQSQRRRRPGVAGAVCKRWLVREEEKQMKKKEGRRRKMKENKGKRKKQKKKKM